MAIQRSGKLCCH
jgi:hypothetical protein